MPLKRKMIGPNQFSSLPDAVHAANTQTLGYDVLNRLTSAVSGAGGYGKF